MTDGMTPHKLPSEGGHRLATSVRLIIEGLAVIGICWLAIAVIAR